MNLAEIKDLTWKVEEEESCISCAASKSGERGQTVDGSSESCILCKSMPTMSCACGTGVGGTPFLFPGATIADTILLQAAVRLRVLAESATCQTRKSDLVIHLTSSWVH